MFNYIVIITAFLLNTGFVRAQQWDEPIRGSWISTAGQGLILADKTGVADIVITPDAHSCVKQAAEFLARDIEKITGQKPGVVFHADTTKLNIYLSTAGTTLAPERINTDKLKGKWEAYQIVSDKTGIWLVGSNPRGTAFAAYSFAERIGVDPLYHWTGYTPEKHEILRVKPIDFAVGEPTIKYRGLFHDDEDTLPREIDKRGYPIYAGGTVDQVWYKRFFETALRLRMNQVAPFVRAKRPLEVRKLASDWGLIYSSHHYDILLSNPFGYDRFGLAKQRGITGEYDWAKNRDGIVKYWRSGIEENKGLDCIWPVGLRGTADNSYNFPKGTTQEEKNRIFTQAISDQVEMTKALLPEDKEPVFHFTLYHEMLRAFQTGTLELPEDIILVWNDDGDAKMRALPEKTGKWKHGIYYHLAFYGGTTKQTAHTITPTRIEDQFRKIVDSGATEYLLLNVSELREHVMNTRFIAEISWGAEAAFQQSDAADRYLDWWCREYFGKAAAKDAAETYRDYFEILHSHDQLWQGALGLDKAIYKVHFRLAGDHHIRMKDEDREELEKMQTRVKLYDDAFALAERAKAQMNEQQAQFFYEDAMFGMLIDYRPTQAAMHVWEALKTWPDDRAVERVKLGLDQLELLEEETLGAERPPYENWYKDTWIRRKDSLANVHYSYYRLLDYLGNYNPRYK